MHAKYALALILVLQVSVSLCEMPIPSQALVDKYDDMRATLSSRISNLYSKLYGSAKPVLLRLIEAEDKQFIDTHVNNLLSIPELQIASKLGGGVVEEFDLLKTKLRTCLLGLYEYYLRPHIGEELDEIINGIKGILDVVVPAA